MPRAALGHSLQCAVGQRAACIGGARVWRFVLLAAAVRSDGVPGFAEHAIQFGGYTRQFWVYVPSSLGTSSPASGLVMFFHGLHVSVEKTCGGIHADSFQAQQQADAKGFIAVCPRGTGSDLYSSSNRGWNNAACCGHASTQNVDDVGFVDAMLDNLRDVVLPAKGVAYPTQNIFAFGFSTGGLFSYRLACDLKDKIDGIAPSGAVFNWGFSDYNEGRMPWATSCSTHVSVWNSLGTLDGITPSSVGLSKWRQYAQDVLLCGATSEVQSSPDPGGDDVYCYQYSSCGASDSRASFCLYANGRHDVKELGEASDYWHTEEAWDFLNGSMPTCDCAPAPTQSPVPNGYERISPGCVWGANMVKYSGKSVEDCAVLCDADSNCLAFEYGVDHGGSSSNYQPGYCQLNSDTESSLSCGAEYNLDLYVKVVPTPAPTPTPAPPSTLAPTDPVSVGAEFTADETLPSGVSSSDLMSSTVYKAAKATGLSVALSVPASDITITGFTVDARRLSAADRELSATVSVTTSFTVEVADANDAEVLSTSIAGAADAIKTQINIAMSAANWSGEAMIAAAPTITDVATLFVSVVTPSTVTTEDSSTEDHASKTTTCDVASIVIIAVIGCLM